MNDHRQYKFTVASVVALGVEIQTHSNRAPSFAVQLPGFLKPSVRIRMQMLKTLTENKPSFTSIPVKLVCFQRDSCNISNYEMINLLPRCVADYPGSPTLQYAA